MFFCDYFERMDFLLIASEKQNRADVLVFNEAVVPVFSWSEMGSGDGQVLFV